MRVHARLNHDRAITLLESIDAVRPDGITAAHHRRGDARPFPSSFHATSPAETRQALPIRPHPSSMFVPELQRQAPGLDAAALGATILGAIRGDGFCLADSLRLDPLIPRRVTHLDP